MRESFRTGRWLTPGDELYAPQVHLNGVTLSGGYLGDDRSINLGVEAQWGSGRDVVVVDLADLLANPSLVRVQREEVRVVFFLSGAFEFAQKTAEDLSKSWIGDDPSPTPPADEP